MAEMNHGHEETLQRILLPLRHSGLSHDAKETAKATFEQGGAGENLPTLAIGDGMTVVQALTGLGFAASNKEARRKVEEGGVRLNDSVVSDPAQPVAEGKLSLGKKKHGLLTR